MTTKKFSALTLPHPRYFCQIGCCDVTSSPSTGGADTGARSANLAKWLPPFTDLIQLIEVRRTGCTSESVLKPMANLVEPLLESTRGAAIVIDDARPELFLRRDFISAFVERGLVYMWPMWPDGNEGAGQADHQYQISCKQNVLSIVLNEKQYRRFGLVAKKVTSGNGASGLRRHSKWPSAGRQYRIDIDLKDHQIKQSNKHQERLVTTLRRLSPVNKLYFRFAPFCSEPATTTASSKGVPPLAAAGAATCSSPSQQQAAADKCIEFFRFVMREYAEDGLKPVPLTGCSEVSLKLDRTWTNYGQRYANLRQPLQEIREAASSSVTPDESCSVPNSTANNNAANSSGPPPVHRNVELLGGVVDLVNWLGYQVLSLDTDKLESACVTHHGSGDDDAASGGSGQVLDVSCCQVSGLMDGERLGSSLEALLAGRQQAHSATGHQDYIELRALILYECSPGAPSPMDAAVEAGYGGRANAGVVLLQDCSTSSPSAAKSLITALNMSSLPT